MNPDPNQALAGDLFNEADLQGAGNTVVVEPATYNLAMSARFTAKKGGIVFVEGRIQDGPHAGKATKMFTVVLNKSEGQKSIGLQNLGAAGIDLASLNGLSKQVGATLDNLDPLLKAIAELLDGRVVAAELVHNVWGANNENTDMQVVPGKMSLISAPAAPAVAGVPQVAAAPAAPAAAAPAAPVAAPAAPVAAPAASVAAPAAPVAAEPVAPVAAPAAPVAAPAAPVAAPAAPAEAPAAPAVAEQVPTLDAGF